MLEKMTANNKTNYENICILYKLATLNMDNIVWIVDL